VNYCEVIADNLKKAGWRCGCISSTDHKGRQFWVVAAEREGARRFIVNADEILTAFLELQAAIHRQREVGIKCWEIILDHLTNESQSL
jgi:hypothetical protein